MTLKTISPTQARKLADAGAILIDVREPREYARERISGSLSHPLSRMRQGNPDTQGAKKAVFLCASGARTNPKNPALAACVDCDAYVMEGGIIAWKRAGLPVEREERKPMSVLRQALLVAGALATAGYLLGTFVNPAWHLLSLLVGCGLLFSGTTNFCPMAFFVSLLPWNRNKPKLPGATGIGQFG
ncbi:rhodanese family protein [Breoghania sp.]|uniref:rhodanese family protein n=1 Tax=Breoghania sp. TaxID=2065378 RepID=UPI002AA7A470|nr:rhodanese family protein [Breoghania sp.]